MDSADDLEMFFKKPTPNVTDTECTSALKDYLPQNPNGSILLTTRDERLGQRLAGRHASMIVDRMSPQEAQDLLSNGQLEPPKHSSLDDTRNLLEALEYLPLAISQAAAFISENPVTLSEYLEILRKSDSDTQELLNEDLGDLRRDKESENSVIKTWKISFDLISEREPRAAEILSLMAVLDRQGIPKALLQDPSDQIVGFTKALGILLAFSLIKAGRDQGVYELHRMVQLATRNWLQMHHQIKTWQEKALSVVADRFPAENFVQKRKICESLLPHAQTVIQYGEELGICSEEYAELLCNVATFDGEYGRHRICVKRRTATYEVRKKLWGEEHPSTLTSLHRLARAYRETGRLRTAQKLQIKFVQISKRVLGTEHCDTIVGMHLLAILYQDQSQWKEAEELLVQAIELYQRVFEPEDPRALDAMTHLCLGYAEQGQHKKAIAISKRCVDLRTRISGPEHRQTLQGMSILAVLYVKQENYSESIDIMERLVGSGTQTYDLDLPWTLNCTANLASLYIFVNRHSDAIGLLERVIGPIAKCYGAENFFTLSCMSNLASAYIKTDRHSDAIPLLLREMKLRNNRDLLRRSELQIRICNIANLATAYSCTDRQNEAVALPELVVESRTEILGAGHPETKRAVDQLEGVRSMQRSDTRISTA